MYKTSYPKVALSHDRLSEAVAGWISALEAFMRVMTRAYSYMGEADINEAGGKMITDQISVARNTFEVDLARLPNIDFLAELDDALNTLEEDAPIYGELLSRKTELVRLLSEAKFSVASVAIAS